MIYFTSDQHFGHANIINMCNRPFKDVEHMNATLIDNWNSVVTEEDEVYILGDLSFKGNVSRINIILRQLLGKKYLIRGNHDKYLDAYQFDKSNYVWVKDYYELDYNNAKLILFHYPIYEWAHFYRKSAHLYGHNHRPKKPPFEEWGQRSFNVGVDLNEFKPVSIEKIYSKIFDR